MVGSNKYYQEINGLRGYACLLVLVYHLFNNKYVSNFWIGVPCFFVISGFLITSILINSKDSRNYFKVFYFKRALRIFPIYYLSLIFCAVYAYIFKLNYSKIWIETLYLQNFSIIFSSKYFCDGIFLHTWSLSVEEFFYLLWPTIIFFFSITKLNYIIYLSFILSFIFKLYFLFHAHISSYNVLWLTVFWNIDAILLGAFLSIHNDSFMIKLMSKNVYFYSLFFTTMTLLFIPLNNYLKILLYYTTILFSFSIIIKIVKISEIGNFTKQILNNKVIQSIGTISYGLYLYHYIVYRIIDNTSLNFKAQIPDCFYLFIKVFITIFISVLSWYLIEKPILSFKDRLTYNYAK